MILRNTKLLMGILILLAYMGIGIFGLFKFNHMSETPMVNCPYTQNSYSVCENSIDHVNNWRQFSNAVFSSLLIFSTLILGVILYLLNQRNFLNQEQYFYKWKYYIYSKKLHVSKNKIVRWLSLLENSPSSFSVA